MPIQFAPNTVTIGAAIAGGTNTRILFNDGGVLGENAGLTFTKASGILAATVGAFGGATPGTNALAVTGTASLANGAFTVDASGNTAAASFVIASQIALAAGVTGGIVTRSSGQIGFSANSTVTGGNDTYMSRASAGVMAFNGAITAGAGTFSGALASATSVADTGYNYQTPSTGFTITMANGNYHLILDPAGTLATGTITMCAAPVDGQVVDIKISQIITALSVAGNSGQSVKGNPTSAAVGSSFTGIYRATNTTWYF